MSLWGDLLRALPLEELPTQDHLFQVYDKKHDSSNLLQPNISRNHSGPALGIGQYWRHKKFNCLYSAISSTDFDIDLYLDFQSFQKHMPLNLDKVL